MQIVSLCSYEICLDDEDVERVLSKTWSVPSGSRPIFYSRIEKDGKSVRIRLERFLLQPACDKMALRLAGTSPLDFRKVCFIEGSMTERSIRLGKRNKAMTSKFKGVSAVVRSSSIKWAASIRPKGLSINLGLFDSEKEAAAAYNRAALVYFGETAFQNDLS